MLKLQNGGLQMATMTKLLIHIPVAMKKQLDGLRSQGYTASGFIRALLERELKNVPLQKGR